MANNTNGHDGGSGEFCIMCGRSDKQAGKMVCLPGGLKVCQDCMQKTMDMASKMDLQSLWNNPMFMQGNPFFNAGPAGSPNKEQNIEKTQENSEIARGPEGSGANPAVKNDVPGEPKVVEEQQDEESPDSSGGDGKRPNISFLNLGDLFGGGFGGRQQPKVKKKKKDGPKPVFSIDNIPAPHKIKEELDKYVIGQERAKKVITLSISSPI